MTQTVSTRPSRMPGLEISVMPDGYVVYDSVADRIHYLNAASALILELCDGENTIEDISAAVMEGFDLESSPLETTRDCISQMVGEKLVVL